MYFFLLYRIASNGLSLNWRCISNYIAVCFSVSLVCSTKMLLVNASHKVGCCRPGMLHFIPAFMTICWVSLRAEPLAWRWAPLLVIQGGRLLVRHPFSMVCWAWCKDSFHSLIKVKSLISYTQHSFSLQVCYCFTVPINDDSVALEQVTGKQ